MSNYQKGASFERDVENRLWDDGWATVRAAGSGTVPHESCDLVAMKTDRVMFLECKVVDVDSLPLDVSKESDELRELKRRGGYEAGWDDGDYVSGGPQCWFVLSFSNEDSTRYCTYTVDEINEPEEYRMFYRLLE